ncbi:MAG TPA: metalloregulator ArsR/SmtB family transcription factor [Gemmatimonadaceae bacterium]|nr:metalloregulator ArsR/SmtB family transcription factor [Gemmatimonadaceae bacterium]
MKNPNAVYRALADPTRRQILKMLRGGPKSSGDIAAKFPTAWATISRHLAVLRDADLIIAERNGNSISYELNTTVMQGFAEDLIDWIKPRGGK